VREKFTKTMPLLINDKRLSGILFLLNIFIELICVLGVFGANCYLSQNVLFEYFTCDALLFPSSDLFNDLLNDIHSSDEGQISVDRRLWPSSEGHNNVVVSQDESCGHYCACYGQHLLFSLEKFLEKSSGRNLSKTI
jgi:hypothetical protein